VVWLREEQQNMETARVSGVITWSGRLIWGRSIWGSSTWCSRQTSWQLLQTPEKAREGALLTGLQLAEAKISVEL
jgi:hypothetical protein